MIKTWVTVHDQDILIDCERSGQFDTIEHSYLFVGPRPVDRLRGRDDVVVCREFVPNYEHWPSYYDFTGWWVLAAGGHAETSDHIILIQYDMEISDLEIEKRCSEILWEAPGPIAFTAGHNLANNFMLLIHGFPMVYRRGMALKGIDMSTWAEFNEWPSTQGMAWRSEDFVEFMVWFEPLFNEWAHDVWCGHLAERTVKAWCVETGKTERYLGGMINHLHRDCHGTCALMGGDHRTYNDKASTFGV